MGSAASRSRTEARQRAATPDRRCLQPASAVLDLEFDRDSRAYEGLRHQKIVRVQEDVLAAALRCDEPVTARSVEPDHSTSNHVPPQPQPGPLPGHLSRILATVGREPVWKCGRARPSPRGMSRKSYLCPFCSTRAAYFALHGLRIMGDFPLSSPRLFLCDWFGSGPSWWAQNALIGLSDQRHVSRSSVPVCAKKVGPAVWDCLHEFPLLDLGNEL